MERPIDYPTYLALYKKRLTKEEEQILIDYCDNVLDPQPKVTGPCYFEEDITRFECEHANCSRSFRLKETLDKHRATHLKTFSEFPCEWINCDKVFKQKVRLDLHIQSVHLNVNFCCEECGKKFAKHTFLIRHMKKFHHQTIPNNVEVNVGTSDNHQSELDDKGESCTEAETIVEELVAGLDKTHEECHEIESPLASGSQPEVKSPKIKNQESKVKKDLEQNGIEKVFMCRKANCCKVFSDKRSLVYHNMTIHLKHKKSKEPIEESAIVSGSDSTQSQPLPEPEQNTKFKFKLTPRKRKKGFVCKRPNCGKVFKFKSFLLNHKKKVHNKVSALKCDPNLVPDSSQSPRKGGQPIVRSFTCEAPDCDQKFLFSSQLYKHLLKSHSNIKTFKCLADNCGKGFVTELGLRLHHKKSHKVAKEK